MRGLQQVIVTALLAYATYKAAVCPCRKVLSCHLKSFYGPVIGALAIVTWENFAGAMVRNILL